MGNRTTCCTALSFMKPRAMDQSVGHWRSGMFQSRSTQLLAVIGFLIGFIAHAAYADEIRDDIIKTETQIGTIVEADAITLAEGNYRKAKLRLEEARAAEDDGADVEAARRAKEARLQAEIVQERIRLGALQRVERELRQSVEILRQEVGS